VWLKFRIYSCSYNDCIYVSGETKKLEKLLNAASKEEGVLQEQQPLYIDQDDGKIKCYWYKDSFCGSVLLKHNDQHMQKSSAHDHVCPLAICIATL